MLNREEVEAFIKAAFLELGPDSEAEWAIECAKSLRRLVSEIETNRERPLEYYRPNTQPIK